MLGWPDTREALEDLQRRLAVDVPEPWAPPAEPGWTIGAVFAAFSTRHDPGATERVWAVAVVGRSRAVVRDDVEAPYEAGFLALREGPFLERAVRALDRVPDVLLVNATGRDHPRGAGLALHLGAVLGIPTVGVTDRTLVATLDEGGRLVLGGQEVGRAVQTSLRARPVFAHAAWRTDVEVAVAVVVAAAGRVRTPEPLRLARFLARSRRARDEGRTPPGWSMDRSVEVRFPRD